MQRNSVEPVISLGYGHIEEIRGLIEEYTAMLVEMQPSVAEYLGIQGYEAELADLTKKYGLPGGRLYVAHLDGEAVGCIALRRLNDEDCEMKRLFVKPACRGHHLGRTLVERIVADAREIGYRRIYLDTLPFLESAIRIYKAYGWQEIERYNDSPLDNTVYMRLDL